MAEIRLKARSSFAGLLKPGRHGAQGAAAGVSLSERTGLALCVISAGANKASEVAFKMHSVTGLDLPMGPKRLSNGFALIGTAPGQWLAVAERKQARALPAMLGVALKGLATVVDLSDGKAVLRISGPRARDTLAKGCSLDLHPRVFKPGSVATTPVALIDCVIWQVDEAPTYDLAVPTSYAESFWSWLTASAAEYGYTVK
jgi:methylglutamate dehydrogenase subunit D